MTTINDLQIAMLSDDKAHIRELLNEIDRRSENDMFRKAGEHFGFKTVEHQGNRLAIRAEISRVMGYKDESGLRKVCDRYDFGTLSLGGFGQNGRMLLIETFGLHPQDGKTVLVGWETFLLAGMQGQSDEARQVQLYLLQMEKAGRVAGATLSIAKGRSQRIGDTDKVVRMVCRAETIKNAALKSKLLRMIDETVDGALELPQQGNLFEGNSKK